MVFAGDHGVTAAGVSAYPAEVTAQMVANFDAGGAAINVLAEAAGASVRVVDIAVDVAEPLSPSIGAHKVRRGSGNIAVEDALSAEEAAAAIEAGRRIADEEVDAGADLLIAGDMGIGNTTAATTLIAALTDVRARGRRRQGHRHRRRRLGAQDRRRSGTRCTGPAGCPRIRLGCCGCAAERTSPRWRDSAPRPPCAARRCCSTAWW